MDLTRRQVATLFTGLYAAGGALLLSDYVTASSTPGAHVSLAWHVYPVALAAQVIADAVAVPGPLDAAWAVPVWAVITAYGVAVSICAAALVWLFSGQSMCAAKESGIETERRP